MDEQEVKVISADEEAIICQPTSKDISRKSSAVATAVRIATTALAAISASILTAVGIKLLSQIELDIHAVTRTFIGEIAGGSDNVIFSPAVHYSAPNSDVTSQSKDPAVPPSESIMGEEEEETEGYVISLNNETPYRPDMAEIVTNPRVIPTAEELKLKYGNDAPLVLIIHTHGSEAYSTHADTSYRTSDKSENVVAIGAIIANKLNAVGITTIHCDTLFDEEDFNLAYYNASLAIRRYLEDYPSVSYIIDVHRDSVTLADGTYIPLTATADGKNAAQLMFVVGTDHGGSGHESWEDNLSLAARLQSSIHEGYSSLMRNINLRSASFNQQYTGGSLILEVGTCANTLEDAKISASIFAEALIREIIGH